MATVTLTAGSDLYPGTGVNTGSDSILGLGGNDTIAAGLGADTVQGGAGNDVITDIVSAGAPVSLIYGGNDDDRITVTGTGGKVEVYGGQGNDWFILSGTDFLVDGSIESDEVDTLELTAHIIKGVGSFPDFYWDIDGKRGQVSGIDVLVLHGTADSDVLSMRLGSGTADAAYRIDGGAGNDLISGGFKSDTLLGGAGNDTLQGFEGLNLLQGDAGNDEFRLLGSASDTVYGGDGNDLVFLPSNTTSSGGYHLSLAGGAGTDTLSIAGSGTGPVTVVQDQAGLAVTLNGSSFRADGFELFQISANSGANLTLGAESDLLSFGGQSLTANLAGGNDVAEVGLSYNTTDTSTAPVVVDGGQGFDKVTLDGLFSAAKQGMILTSTANDLSFTWGPGRTGQLKGFEQLTITGSRLGDHLDFSNYFGGVASFQQSNIATDNDWIKGGQVNDFLGAGAGNDTVDGYLGNDSIRGGVGADLLTGGQGLDVFIFDAVGHSTAAAFDTITDFTHAQDRLDFHTMRPVLSFIGTGAFTAANQIRATAHDGAVWIEVNTIGTSGAEMMIKLAGLSDASLITAADFLL